MTVEQLSYVADIIGVVLIIASLAYVARQLRQNTDAQLATSRAEMMAAGLGDSPDEVRHASWIISYLRVREFAWYQYRNGVLDQTTWESYLAPARVVFAKPEVRAILDSFTANREFVDYIKNFLNEG